MKITVSLLMIMSVAQQIVAMQEPKVSVVFAGDERHDYRRSTLRKFTTLATLLDDKDWDDDPSISLQKIRKQHFDTLLRMTATLDRIKKHGIVQQEMAHAQPESLIQLFNAAEYLQPHDDNTTRRLMALEYVQHNNTLTDNSQEEPVRAASLQKLCDDQRDTMGRLISCFVEVVADTSGYYPPEKVRDGVRKVTASKPMVALLSNDDADLLMRGIIRRIKSEGTLKGAPPLINLIREYVFGNQYFQKLYPAVPYAQSITVMVDGQEKVKKVPGEGHFPLTFQNLIDANVVIHSCCRTEVDGRWSSLSSLVGLSHVPHKEALQKLDFQHNNIQELPAKIFAGFLGLQSLSLIHNDLKHIHRDAFVGMPNLAELDLSNNTISVLPEGLFRGLSNLVELNLSYNEIREVCTKAFTGLRKLQSLDLYDNKIQRFPEEIFAELGCLQKLDVGCNHLAALSKETCAGLACLQKLSLVNNQLNDVPAEIFDGLVQLQTLALTGNNLKQLPLLTGLVRLQQLALERNQIPQTEAQIRANNPQLPGTCKISL